ncbi:MAG: hypothetical protein M3Y87_17390 [Myxococcota bacterium]|nr:hypothetical protein [Myxococcota bacterium]
MNHLLADIARVPLLAAAIVVGFAEVARGPAGASDEVYRSSTLEARVQMLQGAREHDTTPIDIEVRNTGREPCDMTVSLSADWADSFDHVSMTPEPSETWTVLLEAVAPGEERLIALELEAGEPGPRVGEVRIVASAGDELTIPIRTFVAP